MTNTELQNRASDKAFAKITMLNIEAKQLDDDIKTDNTQGITMRELEILYDSTITELKVWRYIAEIIEKSNKYE
jgi:hypothetical protein